MAKMKDAAVGPKSTGSYDAKSKMKPARTSYVEGTKTNKSPDIKSLTPMKKAAMKTAEKKSVKSLCK